MLLAAIFLFSLCFSLSNGLHDASSVVATLISSGAARPRRAILVASAMGMLGAIFGGNAVADTISGLIDLPADQALLPVLLAAVIGALAWNIITWRLGLPSSSTHSLVGGLSGAAIAAAGASHIHWGWAEFTQNSHRLTGIVLVLAALAFSPIFGFVVSFLLGKLSRLVLRNARFGLNTWLNRLQYPAAALLAFSHGANDTQKIIGVLAVALAASGSGALSTAPLWVRAAGGAVMFAGTMLGGWSIMKTIGRRIYDIQPIHSFNSQLSAVSAILLSTVGGAPISTTHVVVGSVMGVGSADGFKYVHWQIVREIITGWVTTLPAAGLLSAGIFLLLKTVGI